MRRRLYAKKHRRAVVPRGWRLVRESEQERYAPPPARSRRIKVLSKPPTKEERA